MPATPAAASSRASSPSIHSNNVGIAWRSVGNPAALTVVFTGGLVLLGGEMSPPPLTVAVLVTAPTCVGVTSMVATESSLTTALRATVEQQATVSATVPQYTD